MVSDKLVDVLRDTQLLNTGKVETPKLVRKESSHEESRGEGALAAASVSLQFSQTCTPGRTSQAIPKKGARSLQRPWGAPLPIPTGQAPQQGRHLFRQPLLPEPQPSIVGDALTAVPIPSIQPIVLSTQCWEGFDEEIEEMPDKLGPNESFPPTTEHSLNIIPWSVAPTLDLQCDGGGVSRKGGHSTVNIRNLDLGDGLETPGSAGGGPTTPVSKPSRPPTPVRLALAPAPPDTSGGPYPDMYNFTGGRRRASAPDNAARPPSPNAFPPPSPALTRATSIMTSLYLRGSLGRQSPVSAYDPLGASPLDARARAKEASGPRRTGSQRRASIPAFRNMERRFTVPAQNDALSWCLDSLPTPPAAPTRRPTVDPACALSRPPSARNGAKAPAPGVPPGAMSRLTPTLDDAWSHFPPCASDAAPHDLPAGGPCGPCDARVASGGGGSGAGDAPLSPRRARWRELGALPMLADDGGVRAGPAHSADVPTSEVVRNPVDTAASLARKESRTARRPQVPRAARVSEEVRERNAQAKRAEAARRSAEEQQQRLDAILVEGPVAGWDEPPGDSLYLGAWETQRADGRERRSRRGSRADAGSHPPLLPLARRRQKYRLRDCNDE